MIDGRSEDAVERLGEAAPAGLDAVLALAGGEVLERCLELVKAGGRVAYPSGVEPRPRSRRRFSVVAYDAVSAPRELERLEQAVEEKGLEVPIAATHALAQAAKAHEQVEQGHVLGRVALRTRRGK